MNQLYKQLHPQIKAQQETSSPSSETQGILDEAASKGFNLNVNDFVRFAEMMKGRDVNGIIKELRESGQMSDEVYNSLVSKAKGFMSLMKLVRG